MISWDVTTIKIRGGMFLPYFSYMAAMNSKHGVSIGCSIMRLAFNLKRQGSKVKDVLVENGRDLNVRFNAQMLFE
jgi:hypothetical protein